MKANKHQHDKISYSKYPWKQPMLTKLRTQSRKLVEYILSDETQTQARVHNLTKLTGHLLLKNLAKIWKRTRSYRTPLSQAGNAQNQAVIEQHSQPDMHPIFVFQMGRVGSISTLQSIKHAYESLSLPIMIYHTHWQNKFEELEETAKRDHADPTLLLNDLQDAKEIRKKIVEQAQEPCNLISLVREPAARNISTFFYALPEFLPNWNEMLNNNSLTAKYLHELFITPRAFHSTPDRWFDEQLKPVFDIDVYASEFPRDIGYKIYSSDKARLLVIRLESLANCAKDAFHDFLQLPNFEISHMNSGEDRETGELYRLFKTKPVSPEYMTQIYRTKYARHFYTETELNVFMRRWTMS